MGFCFGFKDTPQKWRVLGSSFALKPTKLVSFMGVKRIAISIIMIIQFMLRVFDENFPCFSFVELETFKFFFAALFGLFLFHFLRMFCSLFHLSLTIKILH